MSTLDKGYAPLSYHCGSVWPHDTAITLLALAEAGARDVAVTLLQGLLAAAEAFDYRLPELYGGEGPDEVRRPLPYPAACRPQAWSAAAAVTILQAVLGLNVHVPHGEVSIQPLGGLGQVAVEDLRIAGSRVDIAVNRAGGVTVLGLPERLTWVDRRHDVERMQVPALKLPTGGAWREDTVTQ
jgi:glycogen debranching enzyme